MRYVRGLTHTREETPVTVTLDRPSRRDLALAYARKNGVTPAPRPGIVTAAQILARAEQHAPVALIPSGDAPAYLGIGGTTWRRWRHTYGDPPHTFEPVPGAGRWKLYHPDDLDALAATVRDEAPKKAAAQRDAARVANNTARSDQAARKLDRLHTLLAGGVGVEAASRAVGYKHGRSAREAARKAGRTNITNFWRTR